MDLSHSLVMVSGGPDSVAMLRALVELDAGPTVLHLDHGLRGQDSGEDATAALDLDDLKEAFGNEDTFANRREKIVNAANERQESLIAPYRELRQAVREAAERAGRQLSAASEPLTLVVEMNERNEIERVYETVV